MKEQDLVNQILDWLHLHRAWAIRVNSGAQVAHNAKGQKHFIRLAPAGTPDILFCWPGGLFGAVEAKIGKNTPTDLQSQTIATIREIGGLAIVAYSVDDVEAAITERVKQCQEQPYS